MKRIVPYQFCPGTVAYFFSNFLAEDHFEVIFNTSCVCVYVTVIDEIKGVLVCV